MACKIKCYFLATSIFLSMISPIASAQGSTSSTSFNIPLAVSMKEMGTWHLIGKAANGLKTYFDPYQTTYDIDGNVETNILSVNENQVLSVEKVRVNCAQRLYQTYTKNSGGATQLNSDWVSAGKGTLAAEWVGFLCLPKSSGGELVRFVGMQEQNNSAGGGTSVWLWEPNSDYKPAVKNGKTVKYIHIDLTNNTKAYRYLFVDCTSRKVASSEELSSASLTWQKVAPESVLEFLMNKSCGTVPKREANAMDVGQVSLDNAKAKCTDLGFKKGTEQFGNCVLKLGK